jgi:hypothetical protein
MSKAKMMYAFDHIPAGTSTSGGNVSTYSDFPFTFVGSNGSGAGTISDSGGTWLGFAAIGSAGNFYTGTWKLPVSLLDYTKPRSYIGFRWKVTSASRVCNPLVLYDNGNTRQIVLVNITDQTWNTNQEYYIEVLMDRTNKQRTVWVDGAMVVNAASYGTYASVSTDSFGFCEPLATGASTAATYQYKDMYLMDDPGDGTVSRIGAILAKPITIATATGNAWQGNAFTGTLSGTMAISNTQYKFGGSSLFPGATTSSLCSFPDSPNLRTGASGDVTYEAWVYNTSSSQTGVVFGKDNAVANSAHLTYASGNWNVYFDSSTLAINVASGMALNTWYHVALVRYQGTWYLYQNGVLLAQYATSGTFGNNTYPFIVGNWGGANAPWQGYIDEVRVSNIARYTAAFTPPTAAFVPDANTMALYHFDVASGSNVADSAASIPPQLNTAVNTSTPSVPNATSATDGITPLAATLATGADAGATIQGVLLVASGQRNVGTGTVLRSTVSDQAVPPNQTTLTGVQFPASSFSYGRTMGFLPNAPDGSGWTTSKVGQMNMSMVASAT